jgi:hypothetical protein
VYASGHYVSAHFRHRRGTEHEECERYCANFHTEVPLSHHEYEHLDAVLVAQQATTSDGVVVSFALRFRPAYAVKFAHFISGSSTTPYTIHALLRQQYFPITAAEENYLVKAHVSAAQHESHIVEGFGAHPAVFRASEREAVRIPNHRLLKPGEYLVISRKPLQPRFHTSLAAQSLKTIPGLYATHIRIPDDPDWQVRENLRSLLHFEAASRLAEIAFISPMNAYEFAPDCWEVPKDEEVAVMVRLSLHLSPTPTQLLVQQRLVAGRLSSEYLALKVGAHAFVIEAKAGSHRPDLYRIALADPIRFLFEINFSADPPEPQCARILFQFSSKSKTLSRLTWTSHELPKALIDASQGTIDLVAISKPKSVEAAVSDHRGQRVCLTEMSAAVDLLNFLRQARFPCSLSANAYPTLTLRRGNAAARRLVAPTRAPNPTPRSRHHARLLSAFNRRRVSLYTIHSIGP